MAEVYVTLGEAAELERVKYNTMVKRVLRKQESFVTKTEKSENGGKDVVLVAVSSLSKQARNAWKEREKLKSFTEEFPDKKEDEQKPEVPWYVNTDVDWYIENYKERYYKAVELGNVVRKFLQYDEGDRTKYAEEFAQKYLGKGQRMCQKMFGVSAVEWLNYQQCSKLIEALKSMLKRQKEKEEQDEGLQANSDSQG